MENKERLSRIKENKYREIFGVNKEIFEEMLKILETAYKEEHKKGGRPSVLRPCIHSRFKREKA